MRQDVLPEYMAAEAGVLLSSSLQEEASWAVREALTLGVPAICLDQGGPTALGATCVPLDGLTKTAMSLSQAVFHVRRGSLPRWDRELRFAQLRRLLEPKGLLAHAGS